MKHLLKAFIALAFLALAVSAGAQRRVPIGSANPNDTNYSAGHLRVGGYFFLGTVADTPVFMPSAKPRMAGAMIFSTTLGHLFSYTGSKWEQVASGSLDTPAVAAMIGDSLGNYYTKSQVNGLVDTTGKGLETRDHAAATYLKPGDPLGAANLTFGEIPPARYGAGTIDVTKINASGGATGKVLSYDGAWVDQTAGIAPYTALASTSWVIASDGAKKKMTITTDTSIALALGNGEEGLLYVKGAGHYVTLYGVAFKDTFTVHTDSIGGTLIGVTNADSSLVVLAPNVSESKFDEAANFPSANRTALYTNASMVRSGGAVTQWDDADGNAASFVTIGGGSTYPSPIDAGDDGLQITGAHNLFLDPTCGSLPAPFTIYALVKKTATGISSLFTACEGGTYSLYMDATSMLFNPNGSGNQTNATGIADMTEFKVLTLTWAGGTTQAKVYLDGGQVGAFNAASVGDNTFSIYALGGISTDAFRGYIKGLAFFSTAHSATDVAAYYTLFKTACEQ